MGLSQDLGKQRLQSWKGYKKNLVCTKTQRKGAMTPQETESKHLLVLEGLLWRLDQQGLTPGMGHWQRQSWKVPLGIDPLGGHY